MAPPPRGRFWPHPQHDGAVIVTADEAVPRGDRDGGPDNDGMGMSNKGDELIFVPLGGVGEIGMNAALYGFGPPKARKWIMVDLGMGFASEEHLPGVDLMYPDLSFAEEQRDNLLGILITHGHEDHIGAIGEMWPKLKVPVYATRFTKNLIEARRLGEPGAPKVDLREVPADGRLDLGPFSIEYVPVAHSIPEANALAIRTALGLVLHTGDWKLDDTPVLGAPADHAAIQAIGDAGVLALVCDSTNVFNPEASGSEESVRADLLEAVTGAKGRVLVTTFASNAARLKTLAEVATASGRALCVAGRSLDRILSVARATGYLTDFPALVEPEAAMRLPRDKVMIIATGGQGEERAALARIAFGSHPISVGEGDTVIFSSKQIPGNEIAIGRIQNALAAKGVVMVTDRQAHVHVSGHPGRPELAAMYRWVRPELLIPVHGEMRHMMEQARFARAEGVANALVQSNGEIVRLAPGAPAKIGHAPVGRLVLDGDVILPADGTTINERRKLSVNGQISVAIARRHGKLIGAPQLRVQGLPVEEDRAPFLAEAAEVAGEAAQGSKHDGEQLREAIRLAVRRVATRWTGKKPIVDVLLIEA